MILTSRPAVLLHIRTAEPIRVWTGSHPLRIPPDDFDLEGGIYEGLGLSEIPPIDVLLNGDASESTLTLPGIEEAVLDYVDFPEDLSGSLMRFGEIKFDTRWQVAGGVRWRSTYEAETAGFRTETDPDGVRTVSVDLSFSSANTDRRRPQMVHWSPVEARAVPTTDTAFRHVNRYSTGSRRKYPA